MNKTTTLSTGRKVVTDSQGISKISLRDFADLSEADMELLWKTEHEQSERYCNRVIYGPNRRRTL